MYRMGEENEEVGGCRPGQLQVVLEASSSTSDSESTVPRPRDNLTLNSEL